MADKRECGRTEATIIIDSIFYDYLNGTDYDYLNGTEMEFDEICERTYLEVRNYIYNTIALIECPSCEDVEVIARGYWHTYFDSNCFSYR